MEQTFHVAIAGDRNFSVPIGLAVLSLLRTSHSPHKLHIHILGEKVEQKILKTIELLVKKHGAILTYYDVSDYLCKVVHNLRFPKIAFARFLLPILLPTSVQRVFYADADVMFCDDISELFDIEMGCALLGAVEDVGMRKEQYGGLLRDFSITVGCENENICYYNSGQLLFNLPIWRQELTHHRILSLAETSHNEFPDQYVMNVVCFNRFVSLPLRYCHVPHFHYIYKKIDTEASRECLLNPKFIHFETSCKPFILYPPREKAYSRFYKLWLTSPWRNCIPFLPHKLKSGLQVQSRRCVCIKQVITVLVWIPGLLPLFWFVLNILPKGLRVAFCSCFDWSPPEKDDDL